MGCSATFLKKHLEEHTLAYQVIARKWRPKTFNELVGQDHVSQTLLNALRSGRLPHALLFTGPRGTGKTSSARLLAKSLRCPDAKDFTPCNVCKDCEDVASGRSFDVHELDGASNNGVDAIRELQDSVRSMPSTGSHKLYIIDEVHMLSISAFNALLKTLEEPPAHVIFVLATTEVQKLPNTILSRCQRFDFRRIPIRQVSAHLKQICESDEVKYDDESLWVIARQGEGSMRDSQSLLDQVITYTNSDLSQDKVIEILGLTDRTLLLDSVQALCHRSNEQILSVIERVSQSGHDPKVFCDDLLEELRNLLLVKVNPDRISEIVDLPESEIEHLADLGTQMGEEDIHMLFDMTLKGAADITKSFDPRLVLEMLLLRMAAAPKVMGLTELTAGRIQASAPAPVSPSTQKKNPEPAKPVKIQQKMPSPAPPVKQEVVQENVSETPVPQPKKEQPVPTNDHSTDHSEQKTFDEKNSPTENWFHLVSAIKTYDSTLAAQLENTHIISIEEGKLQLGLPNSLQFLHDRFQDKKFTQKLQKCLLKHWDKELEVSISMVSSNASLSPKEAGKKMKSEKEEQVRKQVESHPLVQSAQRDLKVKITKIDSTNKENHS